MCCQFEAKRSLRRTQFATLSPHHISARRGCVVSHVSLSMQFFRFHANVLPTGGNTSSGMYGCNVCACFFVSRVSDDDADQAPSAERPFWCLVDSSPICSAAFLLRIFGIVALIYDSSQASHCLFEGYINHRRNCGVQVASSIIFVKKEVVLIREIVC